MSPAPPIPHLGLDNPAPDPGGFANSAADAYGQGLRFATSLREAAAQQQKQQDMDRQKAFDEEMKMRGAGATPYQPPPDVLPSGKSSGLIPRDPKILQSIPNQPDPSRITQDAFGRRWLMPDPNAKTSEKTFTDENAIRSHGGEPVTAVPRYQQPDAPAGQPAPQPVNTGLFGNPQGGEVMRPEQVTNAPGGTQKFFTPDEDQKSARKIREHIATVHATEDAQGVTLPDALAAQYEKTHGLPAGSMKGYKLPPAVAGQLLEHMTPTERKENHDDWVRIASDPKSAPDEVKRATNALKLDDKYYQDRRPAKEAKSDEPKPATPAQSAGIEGRKKAALIRAEATFKKAKAAALTPEDRKSAEDDLNTAKEEAQATYEEEIGRYGSGKAATAPAAAPKAAPAAPPPAAAPKAAAPAKAPAKPSTAAAKPPAAPAAPKTAGLSQIRAYAKQKGISQAAAIKEFKGAGYGVGQ